MAIYSWFTHLNWTHAIWRGAPDCITQCGALEPSPTSPGDLAREASRISTWWYEKWGPMKHDKNNPWENGGKGWCNFSKCEFLMWFINWGNSTGNHRFLAPIICVSCRFPQNNLTLNWLVVNLTLWKMMEFVRLDHHPQSAWGKNPFMFQSPPSSRGFRMGF